MFRWFSRVLAVGFVLVCASSARATLYGFYNITGNNAVAAATAGQYTVDVTANGAQVDFKFMNAGPSASSITDVYFDDGSLLSIASVTDGPGTDFEQMASPPSLPGGNSISPAFNTTAGFSADSEPPAQPNGANPGEFVTITFNLMAGKTFADVINDLNSTALRIGIHVQGFNGGGSESFVNNSTPVPLPAAAGLGMLGLLVVGWAHKRLA
jgi:hypothetical protein